MKTIDRNDLESIEDDIDFLQEIRQYAIDGQQQQVIDFCTDWINELSDEETKFES